MAATTLQHRKNRSRSTKERRVRLPADPAPAVLSRKGRNALRERLLHSSGIPDVAIEVIWTSGGINKLEVYRKLGVREVWFYERGTLRFFTLEGEQYTEIARSELLPSVDPELLVRHMAAPSQSEAVAALRAELRATSGR